MGRESFPTRRTIDAIKETEQKIKPLEASGTYWNYTGSPALLKAGSYEDWFYVFGSNIIGGFLKERKKKGKKTSAIDFASGDGQAIRELSELGLITNGLNVNLTDLRTQEQGQYDRSKDLASIPDRFKVKPKTNTGFLNSIRRFFTKSQEVATEEDDSGNILRRKTWDEIDNWLDNQTETGNFDLALIRPGGAYKLRVPSETYGVLLKRLINRLNNDGGLLFAVVPGTVYEEGYFERLKRLIRELNEYPGIHARFEPDMTDYMRHFDLSVFSTPGIFTSPSPRPRNWSSGRLMIRKNSDVPFLIS